MLKITQQEVMDNIIKNLFKTKRKTPDSIYLYDVDIVINWNNNRTTLVKCFVDIQLNVSQYGRDRINIDIRPYEELNKYNHTAMIIYIEDDIFIWNP